MDGEDVRALVYLGWNESGLFAAFDVRTTSPWKNGAVLPLAFQGAAVDLNIGPHEPSRETAGAGDYRIVAAPLDGTTRLVIFMPTLAAGLTENYKHPQTFETGLGKTVFDRVEGLGDPVATKVKEDGKGYIVEMRVPVYQPLALQSGARLKLDASVILSNGQGTHATARIPWHSRDDAGDMMIADTYTESLLRPQNWAEVVLE